jgi:L-seryl-tRNA(Ser) seleniumtransferase
MALIMKVHTSNYVVEGFTAAVPEPDLAALAREHALPFVVDLGSGSLVDLTRWGLPHEPTPRETLAAGADLVTFSGDKLLGGPQAGIVVGRANLVAKIKRNPMKRAMRLGKLSIAALDAVLRLYDDPDRLAEKLPALRWLARPVAEIEVIATRLLPAMTGWVGEHGTVSIISVHSQVGSGAQPAGALPSAAIAIHPSGGNRGRGSRLKKLSEALRALPIPVIGRVENDTLVLDLRCLDDEAGLTSQLAAETSSNGEPQP